jgi:hypothetical protein
MKNAVLFRHRRLLVLCACSAAVHLVLLAWAARRAAPALAPPAAGAQQLSIRLLPPGIVGPDARPAAPLAPAAALGPAAHPAARPVVVAPAEAASNTAPAALDGTGAGAATDNAAAPDGGAAAAGTPLMQMPHAYDVAMPPSSSLSYEVVRQARGAAPQAAGAGRLDWRTDGNRYVLDLDGVLGKLHSEGRRGDAGLQPRSARDDTDGAARVTDFDRRRGRVLFRGTGSELPDHEGIQDRASLLMQLAGIGRANADAIQGELRMVVAGTAELRIARFETLGLEDIVTGAGTLAAWHLVERAAPGVARLDVWLAPAHDWLPVQIRVVQADGASVTQTLSAITAATPPEP